MTVILVFFTYVVLLKKLMIKKKVKEQAEIVIHSAKMMKWWRNYSLWSPKKPIRPPTGLVTVSLRWETEERERWLGFKNWSPDWGMRRSWVCTWWQCSPALLAALAVPDAASACRRWRGSVGSGAHFLPNIFLIHFKYSSSALMELCYFTAFIIVWSFSLKRKRRKEALEMAEHVSISERWEPLLFSVPWDYG